MSSLKISFVLIILATVCVSVIGKEKCEPVKICPTYRYNLTNVISTNAGYHFEANEPEDGICEKGEKYILDGNDIGYPGRRTCVCIVTKDSKYPKCEPGIVKCPVMPNGLYGETIGQYLLRVGRAYPDGPSDGCCPTGSAKWIIDVSHSGVDHDSCFCIPQAKLDLN